MKTFTFIVDPHFNLKRALLPALKPKGAVRAPAENISVHYVRSVLTYQKLMTNSRYQVFFCNSE